MFIAYFANAQEAADRKPSDYPIHAKAAGFEIGAEYLVHSLPTANGNYYVHDYLVVEVAIAPAHPPLTVSSQRFTLRLNRKKPVLYSQSPGMVAASLKYPDWENQHSMTAEAGMGDRSVILRSPQPVERFPGDPRPRQNRLPVPTREPDETSPTGEPKQGAMPVEEAVARAALPEGETAIPRNGALFFPYQGKLKSIHSMELIYDDSQNAPTVLRIF